jgi:murein L,D-transpeptidase YcbB/YkuD
MPFLIVGLGGFAQAHGTIIQTSGDPKAGAGTKHIGINKHAVAAPIAQAGHVKAGSHKAGSASNVEAFDQILADRARHGVDRVVFFSAPATGVTGAVEDAERTKAALDYADALSHGRVDPASLHGVYTVPRPNADLAAGLTRALSKGNLTAWFDSLPPQDSEYKLLSAAYLAFNAKASVAIPGQTIPSGLIHIGDRDARVSTIVEQLVENGYLLSGADTPSTAVTAPQAAVLTLLPRRSPMH